MSNSSMGQRLTLKMLTVCQVVSSLILATACQNASYEPVRGPDGTRDWYAVSCRRRQANCYEQAAELCPKGYQVGDSSGQSGVFVAHAGNSTTVTPTYRGEMLIKCR